MDSPKSIFRVIKLIHWILLLPPITFGALVFMLIQTGSIAPNNFYAEYIYLPMILMVVAIVAGRFIYVKLMSNAGNSLIQKLQTYMKAVVVRNALFEMAGLATCLVAYFTGNSVILSLILIIAFQFFSTKPSLSKLQMEGVLSRQEVEEIEA